MVGPYSSKFEIQKLNFKVMLQVLLHCLQGNTVYKILSLPLQTFAVQ